MTIGIDAVIQRSRQPGGFSERRRFTIAREKAILKMRKFALASPYYYVLELIQAAVANGAEYVDLEISGSSFRMSYVGGGFDAEELAQLFDFLFASKESVELADLRQLALGVNALMLAAPREVVVESGDGTLGGTTRITVDGRRGTVDVGTPTAPLLGTYVRASGVARKDPGRLVLGRREDRVIEERCLTAPVPIIFNTRPLFGYSSQRLPRLFGASRTLSFDEGELCGTIGLLAGPEKPVFKILTWGVLIEALELELLPGLPIGGTVTFDRLHKTADHASIVRDERLGELWARLRPYARQLASGKRGRATFDIRSLDQQPLAAGEIRGLLRQSGTVVALPRPEPGSRHNWLLWARAYEQALGAPVLEIGIDEASTLKLLGGEGVRIVEPHPGDQEELGFFRQPLAEPPGRPWLTGALQRAPRPAAELVDRVLDLLPSRGEHRARLADRLGGRDSRTTLYAPAHLEGDGSLQVEVLTLGRVVWRGSVPALHPGALLRLDLGDLSPRELRAPACPGLELTLAELLAHAACRAASRDLEELTDRVLRALRPEDCRAGGAAVRTVLSALARSTILRLRTDGAGRPEVRLGLRNAELADALLELEVLRTLDGRGLSARGLVELTNRTGGLVYGAVPEVPADLSGLDSSRVLALDPFSERMVIAVVGEGSYVRVDSRDLLAEHEGTLVRDLALGLRQYPDFPVLVEGADPSRLGEAGRLRCEQALVEQLVALWQGTGPEEDRRQAVRHLRVYLCRRLAGLGSAPLDRVELLPLLLDGAGTARSWREVGPAALSPRGLAMHDGWAAEPADLGALAHLFGTPAAPPSDARFAPETGLAMSPMLARLLGEVARLRPLCDFDLDQAEARANPATPERPFLVEAPVDDPLASGVVGLPAAEVSEPVIAIVDEASRHVAALVGPAMETGVVGRLVVKAAGASGPALEMLGRAAAIRVLGALVERLPSLEVGTAQWERVVSALLRFAALHLRLTAAPDGLVAVDVLDPTAERVLDLPLFPTDQGVSVSARRLVQDFAQSAGARGAASSLRLSEDAPAPLRRFIESVLDESRVARPASRVHPEGLGPSSAGPPGVDDESLGSWLGAVIRGLGLPEVEVAILPEGASASLPGGITLGPLRRRELHALSHLEGAKVVVLSSAHPLVERLRAGEGRDGEAAAWVLLSCFACLNEALDEVTNEHELDFQRRVLALLEAGELSGGPQRR